MGERERISRWAEIAFYHTQVGGVWSQSLGLYKSVYLTKIPRFGCGVWTMDRRLRSSAPIIVFPIRLGNAATTMAAEVETARESYLACQRKLVGTRGNFLGHRIGEFGDCLVERPWKGKALGSKYAVDT